MRFIASYKDSKQISHEYWKVFTNSKTFDESATLEDIYNWFFKGVKPENMGNRRLVGVEICQEERSGE